ncbi:bifunctional oligoribonuclease/PAP phosphatase NrnA [Desulfogranum marinum]|jgi:phosphoesterase RecJ-like protein|uniref:DHH family phosphoesterase n=1 Tax=Desulfogranum marinum TaxID=453220 RepID=UPI001963D1AF|nr:bifunctional oligoribonuclease/PAP phosphatase NrnA [Desulfogranum marinum]MBM9511702.1 bifunctional oligoribonuclease/PAP phosphatase NrnA [Desulfogranum marinum]
MATPEQVQAAIQQADNLVLATHINPDGDAIGSLLGMMHILQGMGKKVFAYLEEPVSPLYRFLTGCGHIQTDLGALADFVDKAQGNILGVALDCGDRQRLGKNGPHLLQIQPFLVIDHHQGNNGFGGIAWVEPGRSSTGEMVYDLARSLGREITTEAAECLYAAITTDTGSFKYESTSAHTMQVVSDLIACGVQPAVICSNLYDNYTLGRLHLLQEVLAGLEMYHKDRIAVIRVTRNMLERTFTTMEDTEHFINLPRSVRSVRVAVFIKEADQHSVSVSMRAKGKCDVAAVAAKLGGGGHKNASGFRCHNKSIDEVRDLLVPLLQQAMA